MQSPLRRRLAFESLETRRMLAGEWWAFEGGLAQVQGLKSADVFTAEKVQTDLGMGLTDYYNVTRNSDVVHFPSNATNALVIYGEGGNDDITVDDSVTAQVYISGGRGDDVIRGTRWHDVIYGDAGDDTIYAGDGNDAVDAGAGVDTVFCGDGDDVVLGGKGSDFIYGEDGNDFIDGATGHDVIYGGDGDDSLIGNKGNDLIDGGIGNDVMTGDAGSDRCYGSYGDDVFDGGAGKDLLVGEQGDDVIYGERGNDEIHGGDGKDRLFGEHGKDKLFGDHDNDHIDGGNGADLCFGGYGDDQLKGGAGKDYIDGEAGDNLIDTDGELKDGVVNGLAADIDVELWTYTFNGGSATYQIENRGGTVVQTFSVELVDYTGPQVADIFVGGVIVGQIDTQNTGSGSLVFSTHPTGSEQAFPGHFPYIGPGTDFAVDSFGSVFEPTFVT